MLTPLDRVRVGATVLGILSGLAVVGYKLIGDYTWIEALWLVVITISTVGFAEQSQQSWGVQCLTIALVIFGVTAGAYTFGGLIRLAVEGEFERLLGQRRMNIEIEHLNGHIIVCGFGSMGEFLARALLDSDTALVIVDSDADRVAQARQAHFPAIQGDATDEDILLSAGLLRASSLVITLPSDVENVFITLTARNLSSEINIVTRAEQPSTENKLHQAGADSVVLSAASSARLMARMVTRPSTAELIELVSQHNFPEMELDEIKVSEKSTLNGMNVQETEAHRKHGLLVVAVKHDDGNMIFNPGGDYSFEKGDIALIMGRSEDIQRFAEEYTI